MPDVYHCLILKTEDIFPFSFVMTKFQNRDYYKEIAQSDFRLEFVNLQL